jgi:hypothetical protein
MDASSVRKRGQQQTYVSMCRQTEIVVGRRWHRRHSGFKEWVVMCEPRQGCATAWWRSRLVNALDVQPVHPDGDRPRMARLTRSRSHPTRSRNEHRPLIDCEP